MKKKMLALLVAVTLCMVLFAMPFSASAVGSITETMGGYTCRANLTKGTNSLNRAYATATTSFGTYANAIKAKVVLHWMGGYYDEWTYPAVEDYREMSTYASATATTSYVGSVAVGANGWHEIGFRDLGWKPSTSI